jgi:hypothetical protein
MAENAVKEEEFVIPEGGIADFYKEDAEIEALEREEAEKAFGSEGIANFQEVASRMASYGRGGDDTIAHVATGEIVIPRKLIDNNPEMKESIFNHLRELGIEDPEQYVVGAEANSINPETGLPEFGWLKKAFRKVTRAVKKVVKSVVKVVKKVAPVILPIALSFTPLGPVYGAALGSGIGTLIKGGNMKDALKSALIAGGTGALFSGFTGSGSFTENVGSALADPGARFSQTLAGAQSTISGGGFTGEGNLFSKYVPTAAEVPQAESLASEQLGQVKAEAGVQKVSGAENIQDLTGQSDAFQMAKDMNLPYDPATNSYQYATDAGTVSIGPKTTMADMNAQLTGLKPPPVKEPTFMEGLMDKAETAGDYLFRGGESKKALAEAAAGAEQKAIQETLLKYGHKGTLLDAPTNIAAEAIAAGKAAAKAAGPGLLATYGPSAALAGGALYAAGAFTPPPQDDPNIEDIQGPTGVDLLAQDPEKYGVGGYDIRSASGPYEVGTIYGYRPTQANYNPDPFGMYRYQPQRVAEGGEIFPRRVGGIMPNEGIPGQDSVRAMLMPGEFVMTTDAVKGLGGGSMRQGINNMYGMMRNLEARGRGMA